MIVFWQSTYDNKPGIAFGFLRFTEIAAADAAIKVNF